MPEKTATGAFAAIYDCVRGIPPGTVTSYGDVGAALGVTARTVGWALRIAPEDVPWQRVVGADGYLRIARRSPHLRALQQSLLETEGVTFDQNGRVEAEHFVAARNYLSDGAACRTVPRDGQPHLER